MDERKAIGQYGVSGYILKECRQEMAEPIQDIIEKHINRIFGDIFRMLRNIRMAYHFLDKDMNRKIITTMTILKLKYAEVIWSLHKEKHVLQRIATKMVNKLEDLTYEEISKEMHLTTLKEGRERGDLITI